MWKELGELLKPAIEKRWSWLLICGIVVFILGAGGGIMQLQFKDLAWQLAVVFLGLLLIAIGVYGLIRHGDSENEAIGSDYGLRITSPGENANVPAEFPVEGTYTKRPPPEVALRLFVYSPQSGNYWPSSRPISFDDANQRWRSSVRPAGPAPQEKIIGIAVLGKNSQILCGYYDVVTNAILGWRKTFNQQMGIPGIREVPSDFKECHRIRVMRV